MHKKAQVATFIILGIIILASVALVLYIRGIATRQTVAPAVEQAANAPLGIQPVQTYVDNCFSQTANDAVFEVGIHGGYTKPVPLPSITYLGNDVATWVYLGQSYAPSKKIVALELGSYIIRNIDKCISGIETQLKQQGYAITKKDIVPVVSITDNNIVFKLNYPITISRAGTSNTISDFSATVPARLGMMYDVAQNITAEQTKVPNYICMGCLVKQSAANGLRFNITYYGDLNIIKITDQKSEINKNKYDFLFGVRLTPLTT